MNMAALSRRLRLDKLIFLKSHNLNSRNLSHQSQYDEVFAKQIRVKHLDRSSLNKEAHLYDYIRDHVAKDICDRFDDLKCDSKKIVLNLGSCSGLITKNINPDKIESFIQADISRESLRRNKRLNSMLNNKFHADYVICDEERIPLRERSTDIVMSCLDLHWVNDLQGCFSQVRNILKDNSPFIGCMFGGDTLFELRSSLQLAELERLSGFSSHIAPKTTGQDIARLLQSAGFNLITVDISEIRICYPTIFELMFDLQGMGENNASILGSKHLHRDVLQSSSAIYQSLYGSDDVDQGIPATFQMIHFIGWKNPTKATPLKSE